MEGSKRVVRMEWSSRSFALIVKIGHLPKERRENFLTRREVRRTLRSVACAIGEGQITT